MINQLTPKQEALLAVYRDRWTAIGLSTEPANRPLAERGVAMAYRAAGLEPPRLVIWLGSPMAGCIGSALIDRQQVEAQVRAQVGAQVWEQVWEQVWAQVGAQVWEQVGEQVRKQVGAQVGAQVWEQVWDQVWDQVWAQVREQVWDQVEAQVGAQVWEQVWEQVGEQVRKQVGKSIWGQHDAGWLAWSQYFARCCGIAAARKSDGLAQVARHAGWWWALSDAAIVTERPVALHRDERGRLHHPAEMALRYPDDWGVYAWHGTRVPGEWITQRDTVDPSLALTWQNIEQRRALAEILGWDRVLSVLQPRTIDTDSDPMIGTLLEVDLPDSPREQFLRVLCGTGRHFVLPVGQGFTKAIDANAATYGITPELMRGYEVRT